MSNVQHQTPAGASNSARKVTKQELAAHLSVSPRYIEQLTKKHRIPVLRLGARCIRYDINMVEEALSKYQVQAA